VIGVPESAGDDTAQLQRRASFDTRRTDRPLVTPEGRHCPPGGWSRMERQVVVAHLAGSSIVLIHPGSDDRKRNAAGRDGDLTGLIRPKISGQYGALRLGSGR